MSSTGIEENVSKSSPEEPSQIVSFKTQLTKVFLGDGHRAYTAEELLRLLKLQSPKDPPKEKKNLEQIGAALLLLSQEGLIREVAPCLFKARLFFDTEKRIEHAFIGGMGNVHYHFNAPVFRLNIGVLSLYFIKNATAKSWRVLVQDATIGKNYCFVKVLSPGAHLFGANPDTANGKGAAEPPILWTIEGKYISKTHVTTILSDKQIEVEDHRTVRGTRIDHFTDTGFSDYVQAARMFFQSTKPADRQSAVRRGRFALEQILDHHENFEISFLSATIDFLLFNPSH